MLAFKKLELSDIDLVRPFFEYSLSMSCDASIGGTFVCRDAYQAEFVIVDDIFLSKCVTIEGEPCFAFPLAKDKEKIVKGLKMLEEYARENKVSFRFSHLTDAEVEIIEELYNINKEEMLTYEDYVYDAESIISLNGRKYSKIRNHINHFTKEFPEYKYEIIDNSNIAYVKDFLEKYIKQTDKDSLSYIDDIEQTKEVLDNYDVYGMIGGCIMINDNQVVGFDIGEIIKNVLIVHIEKADVDYNGAFQMIIWEYIKHNAKPGMYVNREDSADNIGLETAKKRWFPCCLVYKYKVDVIGPK